MVVKRKYVGMPEGLMHGNQIRSLRNGWCGEVLIGMEGVVAAVKHTTGKMAHDRLGLEVKVPEHGIRLQAANQANGIRVNVGVKEGHGTACT